MPEDPEQTSYRWNAREYEKHSAGQKEWGREILDQLEIYPDDRVIDIGCGDGALTAQIAGRVPGGRAVGVDNAESMIRHATERYQEIPHLSFQVMDARRLTFENEFSLAFSNAALHWVRDHRPVLAGVCRALMRGGRVRFQMGGRGNAGEVIRAASAVCENPRWRPHFTDFEFPYGFHGPEEYETWLAEAGLLPRRLELVPKTMRHNGAEGFSAWVRTTWLPYIDRVPEDMRERFIAELTEAYLSRCPPEDGIVPVAMIRLEVLAEKPV